MRRNKLWLGHYITSFKYIHGSIYQKLFYFPDHLQRLSVYKYHHISDFLKSLLYFTLSIYKDDAYYYNAEIVHKFAMSRHLSLLLVKERYLYVSCKAPRAWYHCGYIFPYFSI